MKLSELFDSAADRIERNGWWGGGHKRRRESDSTSDCIWLSVYLSTCLDVCAGSLATAAEDVLLKHLGVTDLQAVFDLNDAQPEADGQAWAVGHLREIARRQRAIESATQSV